jgi:hypothetical protein
MGDEPGFAAATAQTMAGSKAGLQFIYGAMFMQQCSGV